MIDQRAHSHTNTHSEHANTHTHTHTHTEHTYTHTHTHSHTHTASSRHRRIVCISEDMGFEGCFKCRRRFGVSEYINNISTLHEHDLSDGVQ